MKDFRILCTGNPNYVGIARAITQTFPNVDCISLSKGYDFTSQEGQDKFRSIIKNYNVFVNISNYAQETLLKIAYDAGMRGHVFSIGSVSEYKKWELCNPSYTAEKRQLRDTSLELCSAEFRTTHITVGGFQDYEDSSPDRMDPMEIAKMIEYVLNSPVNIPVVGLEKL